MRILEAGVGRSLHHAQSDRRWRRGVHHRVLMCAPAPAAAAAALVLVAAAAAAAVAAPVPAAPVPAAALAELVQGGKWVRSDRAGHRCCMVVVRGHVEHHDALEHIAQGAQRGKGQPVCSANGCV